jgi:transposase
MVVCPLLLKQIDKHLAWLEKQLREANDNLDSMIRDSPIMQHKAQIMASVPGVGRVTVTTLLAELPELGTLSSRQISITLRLPRSINACLPPANPRRSRWSPACANFW